MKCPSCGSPRVYPSRLRGVFELSRAALTEKQPDRCYECGRRKWRTMMVPADGSDAQPDDPHTGRGPSPVAPNELDQLDPAAPKP